MIEPTRVTRNVTDVQSLTSGWKAGRHRLNEEDVGEARREIGVAVEANAAVLDRLGESSPAITPPTPPSSPPSPDLFLAIVLAFYKLSGYTVREELDANAKGYRGGATAIQVRAGGPFFCSPVVGVLVRAGLFLRDDRLLTVFPLTPAKENS